jgi:hypothetical protein
MAKDDSYSDLIAEGLDDLNDRENYDSTDIKKEQVEPTRKKSRGSRYGMFAAVALLGLNLLAFAYFATSTNTSKSRVEADLELNSTYAKEPSFAGVQPILKLPVSSAPSDVPAQLDTIEGMLPEQFRETWPATGDFVRNGSGYTYSSTESSP